ncbi:uncharacterized protein KGF55_004500 [Candida pseudojiufengensis]|uniref:uncharacterized protein n=1 Tax=Candida pseudojiufengensis TaxID=497109 RepID=UPI00222422DB|nr:uncharacterized protein KGF55_004500 [Candida pseudojiufengensis]KAI5960607.1 hypothetical protein KGF55_004500 [Candida pseudojiufengensis]
MSYQESAQKDSTRESLNKYFYSGTIDEEPLEESNSRLQESSSRQQERSPSVENTESSSKRHEKERISKNEYRVYSKDNDYSEIADNFKFIQAARDWVNEECEDLNKHFINDQPALNIRDGESIIKWKSIMMKIFDHYGGLKKAITTPNEFDPEIDKIRLIHFKNPDQIVYLIEKFDEKLSINLQDGKLLSIHDEFPNRDEINLKVIWEYLDTYVDPNLSNAINDRLAQAVAIKLNSIDYEVFTERRRKFEELAKTDELIKFVLYLNKGQISGNFTDTYQTAINHDFNKLFCKKLVSYFKNWEQDKTTEIPNIDEFLTIVKNDVQFTPKRLDHTECIDYIKSTASKYRRKNMTSDTNTNKITKPTNINNRRNQKQSNRKSSYNQKTIHPNVSKVFQHSRSNEYDKNKRDVNAEVNENIKELAKNVSSLTKSMEHKNQ